MSRVAGKSNRARRLAHLVLAALLLAGYAAGTMVLTPGSADAEPADGTLTVQVLRDFFGTGVINTTMDTPQQGMVVELTDAKGQHVRGVTDSTGKAVLPPSPGLAGGQYRVDVSIPDQYSGFLRPAPASTAVNHFDSFTSFADVRDGRDVSVITAVWNPNDYTLPDSRYFVPVQSPPVKASGEAADPADRALVSFGQQSRGTCPDDVACPTTMNTQAQVGTTWGLAYDKYRQRLLQSAFAKRLTNFGPAGGGAIYATPADGSGPPTLFATVPDAALTPHGLVDMRKDQNYVDVPGKEGLGGLALTEDGSTLYTVNLRTRSLVRFDATGATALVPASTVTIPDPGCAARTDWRPFSVTAHDAKLYVGGVCSAESTQNRADLKAVVYLVDGTTFTPMLTHTLDFQRGSVANGVPYPENTDRWNPWNADVNTWDKFNRGGGPGGPFINPQPELASLAFSRNGSMILGFRDRFMDVIGSGGLDPRPGNNTAETAMSGGDITMACARPAGGYDWEGTGGCPNHSTSATNGQQSAPTVEYFPGDFYDPEADGVANTHQEAAQGSVAYIPQQQFVLSTELDPARNVNANGVGFYDVDTGTGPGQNTPANGYEFVVTPRDNGFAKAGGLGDVAFQAANAPIQIGNIVWFDGDHNGIQDPYRDNEVPLAEANVNLLDADGKQVATTRTNTAGEYYFGGVGASYELTRAAKYTVQFDVCAANTDNVPGRPQATDLRFTLPVAGDNRAHDSNVTPPTSGALCNGSTPVTAPAQAGGVDHTIDAGVYIPGPVPPPTSTTPPGAQPVSNDKGGAAVAKNNAESLAYTGVPDLVKLAVLAALVIGAGVVCVVLGRRHTGGRGPRRPSRAQ